MRVSRSSVEVFCECPVFKSCVSAAELRIALGGAVVQGSEFLFALAFCLQKYTVFTNFLK